jgi:hypothetical protein
MAFRYHIFCRSTKPLTRADLIEFLEEDFDFIGVHGPLFAPPKATAGSGGVLEVYYDGDAGLIKLRLESEGPSFDGTIEQTVDDLELEGELAQRLRQTQVLVTIWPHEPVARDIWATLACVEKILLREHDGVVYNGKGIYDAEDRVLFERNQR